MVERTFQEEITATPIHLPRAALLFSKEIAYPDLDIDHYLALLDQLTAWSGRVVPRSGPALIRAHRLADFLFRKFAFRGNPAEYEDPRNSYLNEVLDRQLGIPISLSVLFLSIAQRLGLAAHGIGLPGHFIVSVQDALGVAYFDPFHEGRQLSIEDCARLVEATAGLPGPFRREWLRPAEPVEILTRMLNNLRNAYLKRQDWRRLLAVIERLRLLQPDFPGHLRDLGLLHHQMGSLRRAAQFYEQYLRQSPGAPDARMVRAHLENITYLMARRN